MKLKTLLCASLFSAIAGISVGAYAADGGKAGVKAQAPEKAAPAAVENANQNSAVAGKTGEPQAAPEKKAAKKSAAKDKTKHFHPRDGK